MGEASEQALPACLDRVVKGESQGVQVLMTALDRILQRWRIRKARPYLAAGDRVLDVGCSDGVLFRSIPGIHGIGVDPALKKAGALDNAELLEGCYPEAVPAREKFDAICMLAVFEHIQSDRHTAVAQACFRHLKPQGRLILTIPSPAVDHILNVLTFLHLAEGIEIHQHYGFRPSGIPQLFGRVGLQLVRASKFQWGLNHLFVFKKPLVGGHAAA